MNSRLCHAIGATLLLKAFYNIDPMRLTNFDEKFVSLSFNAVGVKEVHTPDFKHIIQRAAEHGRGYEGAWSILMIPVQYVFFRPQSSGILKSAAIIVSLLSS